MKPLISVIVPVYNATSTIEHCISSVLEQTFTNFELILIDDGSKDDSLDKCKKIALEDKRVVVCHQSNQGVSRSRNVGIAKSSGEWIVFVDSDDYLDNSYLTNLVDQSIGCDLVIGGYKKVVLSTQHTLKTLDFPECTLNISNKANYALWDKILLYGTPWGKLFKGSIIRKYELLFPEDFNLHEDHIFYFNYLLHISSIRLIGHSGYNYVNSGCISLSRTTNIPSVLKWNAFNILSGLQTKLIERYELDERLLPLTNNFTIRLYIASVILAYRNKKYEEPCLKSVKYYSYKIKKYHTPLSFRGLIIKLLLLNLPIRFQSLIFKIIIK